MIRMAKLIMCDIQCAGIAMQTGLVGSLGIDCETNLSLMHTSYNEGL